MEMFGSKTETEIFQYRSIVFFGGVYIFLSKLHIKKVKYLKLSWNALVIRIIAYYNFVSNSDLSTNSAKTACLLILWAGMTAMTS